MRDVAWILTALVLLAGLHACGEAADELEKLGEALPVSWDALKDFGADRRGDVETFLDKNLADVKKKAAALGEGTGEALDASLREAASKLEALKGASADGWEVARDEVVKAWGALEKKIGE